jgi:hypothetical protein
VKNKMTSLHGRGVRRFLAQPGANVTGVIAGCDRLQGGLIQGGRGILPRFFVRKHEAGSLVHIEQQPPAKAG